MNAEDDQRWVYGPEIWNSFAGREWTWWQRRRARRPDSQRTSPLLSSSSPVQKR